MDNIFLEFLQEASGYLAQFPVVFFIWGIIDTISLKQYKGKIKRGFRIWHKPLPKTMQNYLSSLSVDVLETRKGLFSERNTAFIRVEHNEALIYARRLGWQTFWPYTGYVDLSKPECVLEFRTSLPMHLFLLPFIFSDVVGAILVAMLMALTFSVETKEIENFLERKS